MSEKSADTIQPIRVRLQIRQSNLSSGGVFPLIPPTLVYDQMTKSPLFSLNADLESICSTPAHGLAERTLSQATRDDFIWSLSGIETRTGIGVSAIAP
jgi:hypothetical protein